MKVLQYDVVLATAHHYSAIIGNSQCTLTVATSVISSSDMLGQEGNRGHSV